MVSGCYASLEPDRLAADLGDDRASRDRRFRQYVAGIGDVDAVGGSVVVAGLLI